LTENGKIPAREELRERWKTADIARMVRDKFPRLGGEVSGFWLDMLVGREKMLMCVVN